MTRTIAVIFGVIVAATLVPAMADDVPGGDAARGRSSYQAYGCWQCHGTTGAGGGWQGPKLAPNPIPFAAFVLQLRNPRATMPRYTGELLTDAAVADMYAYLRSIEPGRESRQIEILAK